jgi:hypothetical protein
MEIQWIILSIEYLLGRDSKLFNIVGIAHRINLDKYQGEGTLHIIAKINMMPHEESTEKKLKLEIIHNDKVQTFNVLYKLPSWDVWINEWEPYIAIPLRNMKYDEGRYTFRISVDGEFKNEEVLNVGHYGG